MWVRAMRETPMSEEVEEVEEVGERERVEEADVYGGKERVESRSKSSEFIGFGCGDELGDAICASLWHHTQ